MEAKWLLEGDCIADFETHHTHLDFLDLGEHFCSNFFFFVRWQMIL